MDSLEHFDFRSLKDTGFYEQHTAIKTPIFQSFHRFRLAGRLSPEALLEKIQEYQMREEKNPKKFRLLYQSAGKSELSEFTYSNDIQSPGFDWSLETHQALSSRRPFQLRRQFPVLDPLRLIPDNHAFKLVEYYQENRRCFYDQEIYRIYVRAEQFQLLSDQMSTDGFVFHLLEKNLRLKFLSLSQKIQENRFSETLIKDEILFGCSENFIPFVV